MRISDRKIKRLVEKYKEIYLLGSINTVLGWDLNVNLPPKGSNTRARQTSYLTGVITDKWLEPEFRKLLEEVKGEEKLNLEETAIVRNLEWGAKFYHKVPKEIIIEKAKTTSEAFMVWSEARRKNKFSDFLPYLRKVVELSKIIAEHLGYSQNPYDALLDLYEPGLTALSCEKIFRKLQPILTGTLKKIQKSKNYKKESYLVGGNVNYPIDDEKQLALFALRLMGYDLSAGRMDVSAHPFTESLGRFDVRITNRYKANDFRESLMVAMHEGGHALYEQGVGEDYEETPLDGGVSLGVHESQSRFWENQIGRSHAFLNFMTPIFKAFYPEQLSEIGTDTLFGLFNQVKPSLIRTEADEITYNLHIALRFEIENGLVNSKFKAEDLPEVWRERMKKYLGVTPATDSDGVLQDVHWSCGDIGYFPTYTLGNLYAAQFAAKMRKEIPVDELAAKGELGTILSWLRDNIHRYGSLYWPSELVKKVTGESLNVKYFLSYIEKKYKAIYGFK